jgi:hypothetical protein
MIALALVLAVHSCSIPRAAYADAANPHPLTARELRAMERFGACVCGPEGAVDWDPRPIGGDRYADVPSCNRSGWNGRNYGRHGR